MSEEKAPFSPDEIRQPEDLDRLDKEGLIAFLRSERKDKVELWNMWRSISMSLGQPVNTWQWQPVDLKGAALGGTHLEGIDLSSTHLEGADLIGAYLEGSQLTGACLEKAGLREVHLDGANLHAACLDGANLKGAHLSKADLQEAHLENAWLGEAHLEGAWLNKAHLDGAFLVNARLHKAHLDGASLHDTQFYGADLREAHLGGAHLEGADLKRACLEGAALNEAHLEGAKLIDANLEGAYLLWAHLEEAELHGATLDGADLREAHLRGVALSSVASLRGVRLYQTYFWGVLSLRHRQFLDERGRSTIWEEAEGRFNEAKEVYKALKGYFEDAGDYEGANWAYICEKAMEKLMCTPRCLRWLYPRWREHLADKRHCKKFCRPSLLTWLRLEFAKKIANYGNSLSYPFIWLLSVILLFTLVYWGFGLITAMPGCSYPDWRAGCEVSRNFGDALLFSLGALTTIDVGYVQPALSHVGLLTSLEALLGIALTGLFGFVLGNKLRHA